MSFIELLLIGVALSMDAAAVSACKGLAAGRATLRHCLLAGVYFGGFQALMPALGYTLGSTFSNQVSAFAPWIAFVLLALIGANMIRESFGEEECCQSGSFAPLVMLPMAVATSIDALVVGVSFAPYMNWLQMLGAVGIIGVITLVISACAVKLGSVFGAKNSHLAGRIGGAVLVLIGIKFLLEAVGVWPF